MIKLFGIMLVLLSGTMIGFQQASRYTARTVQLRQLVQALHRLETEIGYGHTPLPAALMRASGGLKGPVGDLFRSAAERLDGSDLSFQECWTAAVEEDWRRTALRGEERTATLRLGGVLGISDKEDQLKHLRIAALQIQAEEQTARDEQARFGKMWRSLGFLAAALVVILMV